MSMDDRKKLILQAIVEDYIANAEPVGSRRISKNTDLNLSAATIRNEMGDLEEMGFLIQPHTSAGRIPSGMGFRLYVDTMMRKARMTASEIRHLRSVMMNKISEFDTIVKDVSSAFSAMTNMPIFGMLPTIEFGMIKSVKLVLIDEKTIMAIVADASGIIKNKLLRLRKEVSEEALARLNTVLNENLADMTRSEISLDNIIRIKEAVGVNVEIMASVLELVHEAISEIDSREVFTEGASNILKFPEYNDIEKIKEILDFFDDKEKINEVINALPAESSNGASVLIGDENTLPQLKDNSVIVSTYKAGDNLMGIVGVIGPMRMNYSKIVPGVEFFANQLGELLNEKLFGADDKSANDKGDG